MGMTGFICHDDYYDRLKRLTNEEVGNLFRQLMLYRAGRYDEMTDFIGSEGIAFDFIADDIDRMAEKQNKASETNSANGAKGGRPKKQTKPEETEENRIKPTETEQKPNKDKDKDKDKDKNNIQRETLLTECKEKVKRFIPPTVDEVRAYCSERQNRIDPQTFVDFYASKGWMVGKSPMKDWKACVRTWEKGRDAPAKRVVAQEFEQRDYSHVDEEMVSSLADEIRRMEAGG